MSKYNNWTDQQLELLLENYGNINTDKLSKIIDKSIGSIYYILNKEKIKLENRWWTKDEIKKLKVLYPSYSNQDLEDILSRSEDAIQFKADSLNLKKVLWWSEEDIELLKEMNFEGLSHTKISKILGRSRSSVHNKLIEYKLTESCEIWSEQKLKFLKELATSGLYTYQEIAFELEATPAQINSACKNYEWRNKIKRTVSHGNNKMISLLKTMYPRYTLKQEYHIGEKLRLDVFIKELNLGFEYDGIQHFKYTPQWHKTQADFRRAQDRDNRKNELCLLNNITLIRIKYNEQLTKDLLWSKITNAIELDSSSKKILTVKKSKLKQKIQSKGFQKLDGGYKWPKRKLNNKKQ